MSEKIHIEPGIYFDLPEADYHAAHGLSNSGMKDLAVSELRYWHRNLNPNREQDEETPAQRWGKAVHCRLLEPKRFSEVYAKGLSKDDCPDALMTTEDLQEFCKANGLQHTAKRKQELVDRIREAGHTPIIWDEVKARHEAETEGCEVLTSKEFAKLDAMANQVLSDPAMASVLSGGLPEVSFFVNDPETGVLLKARMDYVKVNATIDLKTFSNTRGKSTDRAVFDAIYHEGYYQQCVFYQKVRRLAREQLKSGHIRMHGAPEGFLTESFVSHHNPYFGFLFIESSEPFDVRLIQLVERESVQGQLNVYWNAAELAIDARIRQYEEACVKYGGKPWREPVRLHVLSDLDLPQLAFSQ